eukprot:COSAG01_NODE_52972_length_342_cov_1.222222_1_plen_49_part_10
MNPRLRAPAPNYALFPYKRYFRNHAWLIFTYILDARITDYIYGNAPVFY